jgi:hypothetical protein
MVKPTTKVTINVPVRMQNDTGLKGFKIENIPTGRLPALKIESNNVEVINCVFENNNKINDDDADILVEAPDKGQPNGVTIKNCWTS